MDQVNGTTPAKKKQVFFSIGSYSERDKRVINKISTNGLFASATTDDAATIRPQPSRTLPKTRPFSLNFLDSTPKYKTLPSRHRYNDGLNVEKPTCPPSSVCNSPAVEDGPVAGKPAFPPKIIDRSLSLEPEQLRHTGRVALTIAAYEGEPRTPTRLDFLPSGRLSRNSSKASSSNASTPGEDVDGSRMMLQNELVATLKRSNLKKRTELGTEDNVFQENGTPGSPQEEKSKEVEEPKNIKSTEEPEIIKVEESKTNEATPENVKVEEESKTNEVTVENVKVADELKNNEVTAENVKVSDELENNEETSENVKVAEELKDNEVTQKIVIKTDDLKEGEAKEEPQVITIITPNEETDDKSEIKNEIDAALTELENSTEEAEIIPIPPPMPQPEKPAEEEEPKPLKVDSENFEPKEEPKPSIVDSENGEPNETPKTVELSNGNSEESTKESKDHTDEIPNGNVKKLAVELGKSLTFKADIERIPEQNGIKDK